jgi:RNA polymerase sigma-70 factor (ECF subfamily)
MAAIDEDDLGDLRPRLVAFCYRMLGSPFEAEDAAQDALERVWRARESFDPARAGLTVWAYGIARNVCVDRLRRVRRRPLPRDLREPGLEAGAPLVPALDVPWLQPAPAGWLGDSAPEAAAERSEEVRFAVTAMLQSLSPAQRGAFVLRDVMGLSADETATALSVSVASANSALQRARAAIREGTQRSRPLAVDAVERYARAIESADVAALAALVSDDLVFEMPPVPQWSIGREPYVAFMSHLFDWRGRDWTTVRTRADGQHALLLYRLTPGGAEPHTVQVFDGATEGGIGHVLVYQDPRLFRLFEEVAVGRR